MKLPMTKRSFPGTFLGLSAILALSVGLPLPGRDGRIAHLPTVCPFYALTGLPCPGCGLTRAFVCLGHGQVLPSLHWHPLGIVLYTLCVALWAVRGWEWLANKPIARASGPLSGRWSLAGLVLLLGFGAARIGWVLMHGAHWPG